MTTLTHRTNGTLVDSSWFNDYYDLLTGTMTGQAVTIANSLTLTGGYGIVCNGQFGKSAAGDIIDASGSTTYIKAGAGGLVTMQIPSGTTIMNFKFDTIECNNWLGIRTIAGTKLGEFKGNGNLLIAGGTFQSAGGSVATGSGGSFDTFDVAEVFECDKVYAKGTVVCPGDKNLLSQCTHDNCHAAMIISDVPGLGLGVPEPEKNTNYVALAGRVNVKTASDILPRQLVVSDGRGGVRPVAFGEPSFVLGFALNNTCEEGDMKGTVGIMLRSIFVILKQPTQ